MLPLGRCLTSPGYLPFGLSRWEHGVTDFKELVEFELMKGYLERLDGAPVSDNEVKEFIEKVNAEAARLKADE